MHKRASGLSFQQLQMLPSVAAGLVVGSDAGPGVMSEGEAEMSSEGQLGEADISMAEQRAGSLSPRGQWSQRHCELSSLVIDIFNLDPIIQQVQEKANFGEDIELVEKPRRKGVRPRVPTDRTLRSKTKVCSNSISVLSDD